jgi:hypothetical protein
MPIPYATADDVSDRWPPNKAPLTEEERTLADTLAMDASFQIRRRFPTLEGRIADGFVDEREVRAVVARIVKDSLLGLMQNNGEAVTSTTDQAGPFAQSRSYANPFGNLYLGTTDLALLGDLAGVATHVRSVRLTTSLSD